jgi:hypothetical protein
LNTTTSEARAARWIRISIGAALAAGVVWYAGEHRAELEPLRALSVSILGAVLALRVVNGILQTQTMLILFRAFGPVSFRELILLNAGSTVLSALIPFAGASMKAVYLEKRHQIRFGQFAGAMGAMAAVRIAISGLSALIGIGVVVALGGAASPEAWVLAGLTFAAGAGLVALAAPLSRAIAGLGVVGSIAHALLALSGDRRRTAIVVALTGARAAVGFAAFGLLAIPVLGSEHAFWIGGAAGSIASTLEILKLTPGNFGSYEALAAVAGATLGMSTAIGIGIAAVSRLLGYASMLLLTVVALAARPISAKP